MNDSSKALAGSRPGSEDAAVYLGTRKSNFWCQQAQRMDYCDDVVVLMFQGADYTVSLAADFASLRSGASSDRIRSRLGV